mgnify:CR=1 FL=1
MTKNKYTVTGICSEGSFKAECIAYDIISAINLFRDNKMSVHTVPTREQVSANSEIGITNIAICNTSIKPVIAADGFPMDIYESLIDFSR